jgi:hypothetical protein
MAESMAQVIEHLPSKKEALCSNPHTTPTPKKWTLDHQLQWPHLGEYYKWGI